MARTTGRIVLPKNPADLLNLAKAIYEKHVADGAASPLNAMSDYNWAEDGPKIAACIADHTRAEASRKDAESAYARRDLNLAPISAILKNSAAVLKSAYAKSPKKLGDWGIVVDDSKQLKKEKKA